MTPAVPATLVLCMAGLYRRFREAGYTTPKYLLDLRGRPILEHVIEGFTGRQRLVMIANVRDRAWAADVERFGEVDWIGDTSGQAETAAIGARAVNERGWDGPIVFHNVDTLVPGRDLGRIGAILATSDGYIDTFDSDSPAYSYVGLEGDRVTAIVEKRVISRHATSGLYGFKSAGEYLRWAERTTDRPANEFYISDVYRTMIDAGADVRANPQGEPVQVLGTPAEYEAAVSQ